jgi:hypothetical protein|tara:strand:+ start:1537 stop:2364 length:828 start_codon:yes stop_codon:yes gene_type:complete
MQMTQTKEENRRGEDVKINFDNKDSTILLTTNIEVSSSSMLSSSTICLHQHILKDHFGVDLLSKRNAMGFFIKTNRIISETFSTTNLKIFYTLYRFQNLHLHEISRLTGFSKQHLSYLFEKTCCQVFTRQLDNIISLQDIFIGNKEVKISFDNFLKSRRSRAPRTRLKIYTLKPVLRNFLSNLENNLIEFFNEIDPNFLKKIENVFREINAAQRNVDFRVKEVSKESNDFCPLCNQNRISESNSILAYGTLFCKNCWNLSTSECVSKAKEVRNSA